MIWFWLTLAYLVGLLTPPIAASMHNLVAGAIWQFEKLRRRR